MVRIAVVGGTGTVGRHVVDVVRAAGREPVVLARSTGVDLLTGAGLDGALRDVDAVVDVTNFPLQRRRAAVEAFSSAADHLLAAASAAQVRHLVVVSIVGVDRVDTGYYAGKLEHERRFLAGSVPVSVLRSTQFHEFVPQLLAAVPGPVALLPSMRLQPVAAREAASALVELALGPAVGRAPDLAGPEEHWSADLARRYLRARGSRRLVVPLRGPVAASRAATGGALLPTGPGPRGTLTFDEWLASGP